MSPLSSPLNRHSSWAKAWGTEINLRVAFESFYLERKSVPMVLLVVQGGPGTLATVLETAKKGSPIVAVANPNPDPNPDPDPDPD